MIFLVFVCVNSDLAVSGTKNGTVWQRCHELVLMANSGAEDRFGALRRLSRLRRPQAMGSELSDASRVPARAPLASKAAWRRGGAMLCILCIIVTWILMAEVVQGMESAFPKPYFLRLIVHGFYALCLVLWAAWRFFPVRGRHRRQGVAVESEFGCVEERERLRGGDATPAKVMHNSKSDVQHPSRKDTAASLRGAVLQPVDNSESISRGHEAAQSAAASTKNVPHELRQAHGSNSQMPQLRYNYLGYFNWCYFFGASIVLAATCFVSGWLWYISLARTTVSGNSAIYQSMCTMVYVFSIIFLKERVTKLKTVAVFVSVFGVMLVSFFGGGGNKADVSGEAGVARLLASGMRWLVDSRQLDAVAGTPTVPPASLSLAAIASTLVGGAEDEPPAAAAVAAPLSGGGAAASVVHAPGAAAIEEHNDPSFVGYVFCFASMTLYALYEVLYKKWGSHSADPVPLMNSLRFLGLVGVSTVIFCSPFLLVLDVAGIETFEVPSSAEWKLLAIVGVLDTIFNVFLLFAIMLSSPLFASVGCLLVLPASVAWDYFMHNYELPFWALAGVGCIVSGFGAFVFEEYKTTLSASATAPPLYDYEVLGGIQQEQTRSTADDGTKCEVELEPPMGSYPWHKGLTHEIDDADLRGPNPVVMGLSSSQRSRQPTTDSLDDDELCLYVPPLASGDLEIFCE